MTNINLPKPGDSLPFVVAEWDGQFPGWRYRLVYIFDQGFKKAFPYTEHQIRGKDWLHRKCGKALATHIGLPEVLLADASIIESEQGTEGGGE